jgi:hypothetical protein
MSVWCSCIDETFVYIDEFQSFTTLALANMLSELRKYRLWNFTNKVQRCIDLVQKEPDLAAGTAKAFNTMRA